VLAVMVIKKPEELLVFKKADELVLLVYKLTKKFPNIENYGLVSQMRRAIISIPANIIEGRSRFYKKEYIQFLQIALSSAFELNYYIHLSEKLKYISLEEKKSVSEKTEEVIKMLYGLINSLRKTRQNSKVLLNI
jgi:four helix bundle protein